MNVFFKQNRHCGTRGRDKTYIHTFFGIADDTNLLQDLDVDGSITLKLGLEYAEACCLPCAVSRYKVVEI